MFIPTHFFNNYTSTACFSGILTSRTMSCFGGTKTLQEWLRRKTKRVQHEAQLSAEATVDEEDFMENMILFWISKSTSHAYFVNMVFPELRIWLVDLLHGQGIKPWTKRRAMPLSMGSRGSLAKYRHQTNHVQRRDQRLLNKRLLRPQFSEWSDCLIIASLFYIGNPFERNNHAWLEADQQANNTAHKYLTEAATLTNTLSLAGCDKVLLDCNPPMSQC